MAESYLSIIKETTKSINKNAEKWRGASKKVLTRSPDALLEHIESHIKDCWYSSQTIDYILMCFLYYLNANIDFLSEEYITYLLNNWQTLVLRYLT